MFKNKKISTTLAFGAIAIATVFLMGIVWYLWNGINEKDNLVANIPKKNKLACTEEAKICPDGSAVSRIQPNCEFAPCSEIVGIAGRIIILSQKLNDEISSPVSISGKARGTWFFEGDFPIEIYDSNDKLLGSLYGKFVPKTEEDTWMTEDFVDFESKIEFDQPKTDSGYILFKKDNPSDQRELDESFKLPIRFSRNSSGLANPASIFCEDNGGELEIRTSEEGGQTGYCNFSDGSQCEEWKYMKGECKAGDNQNQIDTSDWQTYRNEEYGFEMKYPQKYVNSVNYGGNLYQVSFNNEKKIIFKVEIDSHGGEEGKNYYLDYSSIGKIMLEGIELNKFVLENGYCDGPECSPPIIAFKTFYREKNYTIIFYGSAQISKESEEILSTFKFLTD